MPSLKDLLAEEFGGNTVHVDNAGYLPGTIDVHQKVHVLRLQYDFDVQGGATGDIELKAMDERDNVLPKNALIIASLACGEIALDSDGAATVALGTDASGDLDNAQAYSNYTSSSILASSEVPIKTSADSIPFMSVADAPLKAGKFQAYIAYILADT